MDGPARAWRGPVGAGPRTRAPPGWADPERRLSVGLITTGKSVLYPELARFWEVGNRIGKEAPPIR